MNDLSLIQSRPQPSTPPAAPAWDEHSSLVRKLESLSLLSGGVAHDFNNLLMTILGNADLALSVVDDGATDLRGYVEEIQRASKRAATLCRQLLSFSGRGRFVSSLIEPRPLILQMIPALEQVAGEGIRLVCDLPPALPAIKGDPEELRRILKQLVRNAGEATEEAAARGPVHLRLAGVDSAHADLDHAIGADGAVARRYLEIEVADEGHGMDAEARFRMFDPFFTTRGAGRGFGMATVYGAVRTQGGRLCVDSEPGAGTRVRVYLPALEAESST